jgi:hypothetical protein
MDIRTKSLILRETQPLATINKITLSMQINITTYSLTQIKYKVGISWKVWNKVWPEVEFWVTPNLWSTLYWRMHLKMSCSNFNRTQLISILATFLSRRTLLAGSFRCSSRRQQAQRTTFKLWETHLLIPWSHQNNLSPGSHLTEEW